MWYKNIAGGFFGLAVAAVDRLTACIADINDWMKASRLRLNPAKTQIMWLGTS